MMDEYAFPPAMEGLIDVAKRTRVISLENKRRERSHTVWDGERLRLDDQARNRDKKEELRWRKSTSGKKKLQVAAALIIAAAVLGSSLFSLYTRGSNLN